MSGNGHDRRIDERVLNFTQRVFDALGQGATIVEIQQRTHLSQTSIVSAIKRLQLQRALEPASCIDGVWIYRRRKDAIRPTDRRGRQAEQEAA